MRRVSGTGETTRIDGRTARRQRGRAAVIDAAFRVLGSGGPATAENLASEAGISTSSLFRYFESLDDVFREAVDHFHAEHEDLFAAAPDPEATREARIAEFVDLRVRCAVAMGPWAQRVFGYSLTNVDLRPVTDRLRACLAEHVGRYFAPELERLSPAGRADLVAVLDAVASVEVALAMHQFHGRTDKQIARAWLSSISTLLAAHD